MECERTFVLESYIFIYIYIYERIINYMFDVSYRELGRWCSLFISNWRDNYPLTTLTFQHFK